MEEGGAVAVRREERGLVGWVAPVVLAAVVGLMDARLATVSCDLAGVGAVGGAGRLEAVRDALVTEGRGLLAVVDIEVGGVALCLVAPASAGAGAFVPPMRDSLALLVLVCLTVGGAAFRLAGTGLALKAGFFSPSSLCATAASFFERSSRAAFSFAATASPGSWKDDVVGAFRDFGGGGGIGNESETGRGLLCGMMVSLLALLSP